MTLLVALARNDVFSGALLVLRVIMVRVAWVWGGVRRCATAQAGAPRSTCGAGRVEVQ
jgi:hypothetical protein